MLESAAAAAMDVGAVLGELGKGVKGRLEALPRLQAAASKGELAVSARCYSESAPPLALR